MSALRRIELKQVEADGGLWRVRMEYGAGAYYEVLCAGLDKALASATFLAEQDEAYEREAERLRMELEKEGMKSHEL